MSGYNTNVILLRGTTTRANRYVFPIFGL